MRMASASLRDIAEHESITIDEVETIIARMSGGVSPHFRERHMQMSLEQLEKVKRANYAAMLKGTYDASVIYLRAIEMSCRLLGLFPPPQTDASLEKLRPKVTSTDEMRAVLDELMGKTDRTIDGQAERKDEGSADA